MIVESSSSKHEIASIRFDLMSYELAFAAIDAWRREGRKELVTITNPHSVMLCGRDDDMRRATQAAGLTLPDGAGIILAANILGYEHQGRVTGPTLMLKLCDWGRQHGYRHYFYGGAEGVGETLIERLIEQFPGMEVAGSFCPPFRELTGSEDEEIVGRINAAKPDVVWVGLGAPKQEKWMADHLGRIEVPAMIGVGAAFDFHSDNVKWAPNWVRVLGVEWAYRLALNPKRMWRRNLDSPLFLLRVILQRVSQIWTRRAAAQSEGMESVEVTVPLRRHKDKDFTRSEP